MSGPDTGYAPPPENAPYPSSFRRFPRLRQSTLASFDRCALSASFEMQYEQDWSTHPQGRGTIFHRVAAEILRTMREQKANTIPADQAVEILYEVLRQADLDTICGRCGAPALFEGGRVICQRGHDHSSDVVNIPLEQVKDLRWVVVKFASENEFEIDSLVDVEQRIFSTITYPNEQGEAIERVLSGQLDAVFAPAVDHAVVTDWKDTWGLPPKAEVSFTGYFQQRFYGWLVMKNYPTINKVTLREVYVRFGPGDDATKNPLNVREASVYRDELHDIERELSALAERFDRAFEIGNFPPSPGKHCQWCPLPERCPIFKDVKSEGRITSQEEAERFAAQLVVAKAAADTRKKELQAWADARGPVKIASEKGERMIGYVPQKRVSRPTRDEMAAALSLGTVDLNDLYKESLGTTFKEHVPSNVEPADRDAELLGALEESVRRAREET